MKLLIEEIILKSGKKKMHIAKQLGVNENTLTNWMKNRSMPKLDQAVKLAKLLEVEIQELYEDDEQ